MDVIGYALALQLAEQITDAEAWTTSQFGAGNGYARAAAGTEDALHVLGGYYNSNAIASHDVYSVASDTWTTKATMGTNVMAYGTASRVDTSHGLAFETIFAIGGVNGFEKTVRVYRMAANQWQALGASSLTKHTRHAATVLNGLIYVMSGNDDTGGVGTANEVYDPVANTWTAKAAVPDGRLYAGAFALDGKIHHFGGASGANNAAHYVYDPALNSWSQLASDFPLPGSMTGGATLDGKGFAFTESSVYRYSASSDAWEAMAPAPTMRSFAQASGDAVGDPANPVYVRAAGRINTTDQNTAEIYQPRHVPSRTGPLLAYLATK